MFIEKSKNYNTKNDYFSYSLVLKWEEYVCL